MTTLSIIADAPQLDQVIEDLGRIDTDVSRRSVLVKDLKLYRDGTVALAKDARISASNAALADLGRLVKAPSEYFVGKCDAKLRAVNFNYLLRTAGTEYSAAVAEIAAGTLTSISATCLAPVPRLGILKSLRASVPASMDPSNIKVIKHGWNGTFDISVVSEALTCEPQVGDVIAFGVSVAEDARGAVQVQAAAYRYFCKNGAVNRICDNNERRLRRPMFHTNRNAEYFRRVKVLASDAWQKWEENAANLQRLAAVPVYEERFDELRSALRNSPFFLSASLANQVLARLRLEAADNRAAPTAYDLWNSLTHIGTHSTGLNPVMAYRLRRGAGELAHHSSRTCSTCHQLVLK